MLRSEWVKPGAGRSVGELRRWVRADAAKHDYADRRLTALDIVRAGPPEPYDVERVEEAIRQADMVSASLTATYNRVTAWSRYATAQADTETAMKLLRWAMSKPVPAFEEARQVFQNAVACEKNAWRVWQGAK